MTNTLLQAVHPLVNNHAVFDDTHIASTVPSGIFTISFANNSSSTWQDNFQLKSGLAVPTVGHVSRSEAMTVLAVQPSQLMVVSNAHDFDAFKSAYKGPGESAYFCDLSDSFVLIEVQGNLAQPALERICSIDLHSSLFDSNKVARTLMEHLSVTIERPSDHHVKLYAARSSANSFWQMIYTSVYHVSATTSP